LADFVPTGSPELRAEAPARSPVQAPGLLRDLAIATVFLTRIPVRIPGEVSGRDIARASRHYPLIGAGVGACVGGAAWLAMTVFPPVLAATLACVLGLMLTGAFHEDALADVADGFGGGFTVERKLTIMKDSLHGTYGVLALVMAMLVRVQAIALLPSGLVVAALVATHALSRVGPVWLMRLLPVARAEGLGAEASRIGWLEPALAALVAFGLALLTLGPILATFAILVAALTAMFVGWLSMKQVGGITGDVLGTAQQLAELGILLVVGALITHAPALGGGFAATGGG